MKVHIDEEADALHLQLVDARIVESEEVTPGIIVDYDVANLVVGIEVLYLSKRPQPVEINDFSFHTIAKKTIPLQGSHNGAGSKHAPTIFQD